MFVANLKRGSIIQTAKFYVNLAVATAKFCINLAVCVFFSPEIMWSFV